MTTASDLRPVQRIRPDNDTGEPWPEAMHPWRVRRIARAIERAEIDATEAIDVCGGYFVLIGNACGIPHESIAGVPMLAGYLRFVARMRERALRATGAVDAYDGLLITGARVDEISFARLLERLDTELAAAG